ncbi:aminodeoxychorismate synthase component I [Ornithinimicrobium sp. Y1694]|uniref:aminodeoxychorismate synthase component I n=1 Tax=Ornithinimicrobium sp. Y1694 TaxID=3418590 RepID=UPI003CF7E081
MTTAPRVLLVDNVDSFTYNIADLLHRVLGAAPVVWRNDHAAGAEDLLGFDAIVVGPGPGRPQVAADMRLSDLALRQREVPVLGVCLGHQGLAHLAGEQVVQMRVPRHGIVSPVEHDGTGIFEGVPSPLQVVRYHSLDVPEPFVSGLCVTARATDDGSVMGLSDPDGPRWGVQFHPESVLTEHGELIVANFLRLAGITPVPGHVGGADRGPVAVGDTLAPHLDGASVFAHHLDVRVCRFPGPVDDWRLHAALLGQGPVPDEGAASIWLDASDGSGWSLLVDATGPLARTLTHRVGQGGPDLLERLDAESAGLRLTGEPLDLPFTWRPGWVGWWGYELRAETASTASAHPSPWPDAWLLLADRGIVIDHASGDVYAMWLEDDQLAQVQAEWVARVGEAVGRSRPSTDPGEGAWGGGGTAYGTGGVPGVRPRDGREEYLAKVRAAQEQIRRGESYEICLTTTWEGSGTGVGEVDLYRAMREVSPVPHGCWIRTPEVSVLGCSPERFVSVDGHGVVESRPIKGTRPRSADPVQDAALAADLAAAEKDRAENLMIVDLLRNDLHRVCRAGSVHVPEIFAVESFATVHQLVSTVRGVLAEGMGPTDVLRACFPGGSMTGAPKVRTMEILEGLEGAARGIYSGAIGWIGLDGSMDTSIVIRTATWVQGEGAGGDVTFGVGGAVTALSSPEEEHAEMVTKAQSVLRALDKAAAAQLPEELRG